MQFNCGSQLLVGFIIPHMIANWASIIGFGVLCLVTIAVLCISSGYAALAGVFVYDYNFETMAHTLSPAQASRITNTVQSLVSLTVWPLLATNLAWIIAFFVLYARVPPKAKAGV